MTTTELVETVARLQANHSGGPQMQVAWVDPVTGEHRDVQVLLRIGGGTYLALEPVRPPAPGEH